MTPLTVPDDPEPQPPPTRQQLSARVFYGLILAGVVLGVIISSVGGWLYLLDSAHQKPTGRRIWETEAEQFVIPVCVMIGGTFGGVLGVASAVLWQLKLRAKP
jgi:hypothetical protein